MRGSYGNLQSRMAASLTRLAHTQAPMFRWGVLLLLIAVWIGLGLAFWLHLGLLEAVYRTVSALSMYDDYFGVSDNQLQAVRFAAISVPVVGLLFAFSGALGRNLAQSLNQGAAHHVVIAGDSPAALALALDCRTRHRDAVILIGHGLSEETALGLRRKGVIVLEGEATRPETLASARAHHAAHVVAFEPDDTANLQIEAAVRRLVGNARRRPPIGVHVATRSPMLLREAREMRSAQSRQRDKEKKDQPPSIDPKPFSLDEMAARELIQKQAQTILSVASEIGCERLHLVFFGFDDAAEAVAVRSLMSLWSARFEAPRLTVLTPNSAAVEARFRARHRDAFAHPEVWAADVAFMDFDWDVASMTAEVLESVEATRGKPSAAIVSTGADPGNIHLSIAMKRICNHAKRWPIPIFMRETTQSEFSQQYARGDDTPELDAYLQAFGAHQLIATRSRILDGALDRGAAIAHEHYNKGLAAKDAMSLKELQAAMRDWDDVLETYRSANRAVSDSALVKMWDAGWRPANKGEKGETAPQIPDAMLDQMARREHDRWVAERLLSGWRPTLPGEARNNDQMAHDKIVGWDALNEKDRANDATQVRAAVDIARVTNPSGFIAR